jgi:hypothetical protein
VSCTGADELSCTACGDNYWKQPKADICRQHCPTGYTQGTNATCEGTPGLVDCTVFDETATSYTTTNGIHFTFVGDGPYPMYRRGLYFTGNDYLSISNLVLSHTFTLEFWIKT